MQFKRSHLRLIERKTESWWLKAMSNTEFHQQIAPEEKHGQKQGQV